MQKKFSTRWKVLLAASIVPLLFSVFFARQLYYVHNYDFSVWKGGGMGMFSSLDHPSKRHLYFYVETPSGEMKRADFQFSSREDNYKLVRFKILPRPIERQWLESMLIFERWYVLDETSNVVYLINNENAVNNPTPYDFPRVRVELWKMDHVDNQRDTMHIDRAHTWEFTK